MLISRSATDATQHTEMMQESLEFLHGARPVQVLEPAEIEWIARNLRSRGPRPRRPMLWPAMIALAFVLGVSTAVAVAKSGLRSLPFVESILGPAPAPSTGGPGARKRRGKAAQKADVPSPAAPSPLTAPTTMPVARPDPAATEDAPIPGRTAPAGGLSTPSSTTSPPAPRVAPPYRRVEAHPRQVALQAPRGPRTPAAPPLQAAAPRPIADGEGDEIVQESRSFASVIEPWHRARHAYATLRLLEAHDRRYPRGTMQLESRVLRADLYLALGRERDALALLDALSLTGIPRARELQTTRGELRIKAGRCIEGKRDLDEVLHTGVADDMAKRAVQAIADCP